MAPQPEQNAAFQNIVARVNDKAIYAREFKRAQKLILHGKPASMIPADKKKEFEKHVLDQLISTELLYQESRKLEVKDLDKQVETKISMTRKRFKSDQEFEKAMKELDMTPEEVREYTRRDLVISNFVQNTIISKLSVSEEESKRFYDQNIDRFKQGATVRASHILIGVDSKASSEDRKKAREKAEKLRKEIAGGAEFSSLAKENSTCPSSKQGGDLGYFGKGQMVPTFEQAAFALKVGDVSDVVETQFGYHIIKLLEKKDAETVPYKNAKARIDDHIKSLKINAAVNAFINKARKDAKIEVLLKL